MMLTIIIMCTSHTRSSERLKLVKMVRAYSLFSTHVKRMRRIFFWINTFLENFHRERLFQQNSKWKIVGSNAGEPVCQYEQRAFKCITSIMKKKRNTNEQVSWKSNDLNSYWTFVLFTFIETWIPFKMHHPSEIVNSKISKLILFCGFAVDCCSLEFIDPTCSMFDRILVIYYLCSTFAIFRIRYASTISKQWLCASKDKL